MTKTAFRKNFLRGLGSALLELQSSDDPSRFYDAVLYGCLHNTTYDMQCEGNRGWYLHQAAKLVKNATTIERVVSDKIFCIRKDSRLFEQMASLLYNFAADGSDNARKTLYQQYVSMLQELAKKRKSDTPYNRHDMFETLCVLLTSLDGWKAFKIIVLDVSEILLPRNVDFFFSEWFYVASKHKFGEKRVESYLQKQAEKSLHMHNYYEKAKQWNNHKFEEPPIPTLDDVLSAKNGLFESMRYLAYRYAKNASPEELEKLAQVAMNETNESVQIDLLWAFRRFVKYPFPEEFLLKLSKSGSEELRGLTYDIMGQNPSPRTRELALSLIKDNKTADGISLLVKSPLPEDEFLLFDIVKSIPVHKDKAEWHSLYMDVQDGIEAKRGKPKTDILEFLYRNTFCGVCRSRIVRLMHKKKQLPDKILKECFFDSNNDIREFVGRLRRK